MENKLDELIKEIKKLREAISRLESRGIYSPVTYTKTFTGIPMPEYSWPDISPNITMGER